MLALISFLVVVALTGGGSRSDIPLLVILRPAAVLFVAYALFVATSAQLRQVRGPLVVVVSLLLLALCQLIPLPVEAWASLPNREVIVQASELIGMEGIARPLSLDPDRTWNTCFALFVPLAAISLTAVQGPSRMNLLIPLLMAVGLLSAILGYLQAIGGDGLHIYQVSHSGYPVGLFANKNHQAVMLLWLMLAGSWLASQSDPRHRSSRTLLGGALASIFVLFPLLILTGSRAGLLLSLPTLLLSGWFLLQSRSMEHVRKFAGRRSKVIIGAALTAMVLPLVLVFAVLAVSGRQTALSRLLEAGPDEDARWQYLPIFPRMVRDNMPFGSGFGSFESLFNIYEPSASLSSRYMNQAHNDLLQIAIEGGLPAIMILAGALLWLVFTVWRMGRSSRDADRKLAQFVGGSVGLWLAASLVDYPLRTPLAATLVAALTAHLAVVSTGPHAHRGFPGMRSSQSLDV